MDAGFPAVTRYSVAGRGKQRGIKIGEVTYDEIPKTMLMSVVKAEDKDFVIDTIMKTRAPGPRALSATARFSSAKSRNPTPSAPAVGRAPAVPLRRSIRHERSYRRCPHEHDEQDQEGPDRRGVDAFFAHEAHGRARVCQSVRSLRGQEKGHEEAVALLGEKGKLYPKRMVTVVVPMTRWGSG
jgi:nitrogen regulatory protein PII